MPATSPQWAWMVATSCVVGEVTPSQSDKLWNDANARFSGVVMSSAKIVRLQEQCTPASNNATNCDNETFAIYCVK